MHTYTNNTHIRARTHTHTNVTQVGIFGAAYEASDVPATSGVTLQFSLLCSEYLWIFSSAYVLFRVLYLARTRTRARALSPFLALFHALLLDNIISWFSVSFCRVSSFFSCSLYFLHARFLSSAPSLSLSSLSLSWSISQIFSRTLSRSISPSHLHSLSPVAPTLNTHVHMNGGIFAIPLHLLRACCIVLQCVAIRLRLLCACVLQWYMYIYTYECIYMHMYINTYICTCICIGIFICIHVSI